MTCVTKSFVTLALLRLFSQFKKENASTDFKETDCVTILVFGIVMNSPGSCKVQFTSYFFSFLAIFKHFHFFIFIILKSFFLLSAQGPTDKKTAPLILIIV